MTRVAIAMVLMAGLLALWSPAAGDTPSRDVRLVRLSDGGPAFLAYDGDASFDERGHDWPVVLVFAGAATVPKVKAGLRRAGFTRTGHLRYLAYRSGAAEPRFDSDRGLKTACDAAGTDVHLRLYAPRPADRFRDPRFGSFVVATAHLDRADGCGQPPKLFGFSEVAERRVGAAAARLGWRVRPGYLALGNVERYRRDLADPAHVWLSDGRATLVTVP